LLQGFQHQTNGKKATWERFLTTKPPIKIETFRDLLEALFPKPTEKIFCLKNKITF